VEWEPSYPSHFIFGCLDVGSGIDNSARFRDCR
jgi:hypothetical protein